MFFKLQFTPQGELHGTLLPFSVGTRPWCFPPNFGQGRSMLGLSWLDGPVGGQKPARKPKERREMTGDARCTLKLHEVVYRFVVRVFASSIKI